MTNQRLSLSHKDELRTIVAKMPPAKYTAIRDAYWKAVEGLRSLADALEQADADDPEPGDALMNEHLNTAEAIGVMYRSRLGEIL